jgi:hypothetical protein
MSLKNIKGEIYNKVHDDFETQVQKYISVYMQYIIERHTWCSVSLLVGDILDDLHDKQHI